MRSSVMLSANSSSLTSNVSTKTLHHHHGSHRHHFDSFRRKSQNLDFRVPVLSTITSSMSLNSRVWMKSSRLSTVICCCAGDASTSTSGDFQSVSHGRSDADMSSEEGLISEVASPSVPIRLPVSRLSLSDQAFFLLAFIACTTSIAFTSLVVAAVPTLYAMSRAATSLAKLADTARDELPSTMAAIRLSGMEISDLTLELSDLSQEIADGVNKSAQAVQAAEAGIRQIGTLARQQTLSIIQERASLPIISLQPVVIGAAKKTSHAVGRATRSLINIISRGEFGSIDEDNGSDKIEV